jgi:hypothetical protein
MKPNRTKILAKIEIKDLDDLANSNFYLLTPEDKSIIKYEENDLKEFSYNPSKKNCIIAILPNNIIFSCSPEEFNKVKKSKNEHTFKLQSTGITLKEGNDLTECLNDLI